MIFDTHTHAYFEGLRERENEVVASMRENGIGFAVQIGCDAATSKEAVALARKYPSVYRATVGLHPTEAQELEESAIDAELLQLEELMLKYAETVVGIGETGWDFYHLPQDSGEIETRKNRQRHAFEGQIALARKYGLPLVIHTRDSGEAVLATFRSHKIERAVIHCFSETPEFATEMMNVCPDVSFGFSGILTYKNAKNVQNTAAMLPLEKILVETDAPFLSPQAVRGTVNESANVRFVLDALKALRKEPPEEVERIVWENSLRFYGLPTSSQSASIL